MSNSSDRIASVFSGLRLGQIISLIEILRETQIRSLDNVERRYLDRAVHFSETLSFLCGIGIARCVGKKILIHPSPIWKTEHVDKDRWAEELLQLMLSRKNPYRTEALRYISNFRVAAGRAVYQPRVAVERGESDVRNLLMDLNVILYDEIQHCYILSSERNGMLAMAKSHGKSLSPSAFQQSMRSKEDIGLAAEDAIVDYERSRVGNQYAHCVQHISRRNVAAGFDIESVSISSGQRLLPRYIEVKAVPLQTYSFYWSANERSIAETFGPWYYLYLLPVCRTGGFNLASLLIVQNPCSSVLASQDEWTVESGVLRCYRLPSPKAAEHARPDE